mmetsp:Transcript_9026/g.31070  ORF Transcript_9026/g.31070 Transcript_9026/m.31070 type:complete len:642 (+) Transcript_9026:3130-5055(+)
MLLLNHFGERSSALCKQRRVRRAGQNVQANIDLVPAVRVDRVGHDPRLAHPEKRSDVEHGLGDLLVCGSLANQAKELCRELGVGAGHYGGQKVVATEDEGPEVWRGGEGHSRGHGGRGDRGVGPVGEDLWAGGRPSAPSDARHGFGHVELEDPVVLVVVEERQGTHRLLDHLEGRLDLLLCVAVLAEDPQPAAAHTRGSDLRQDVDQELQHLLLQLGVGLHDLPDKVDDVHRRYVVWVGQESHQQRHHCPRNVWEVDSALVNGLHEHLPVLPSRLTQVVDLNNLLLQRQDNLFNVLGGQEVEDDVEDLLLDVDVRRGQRPEHVHHHVPENVRVLRLHVLQLAQNDQLDVVVAVVDEKLAVARSGGPNGRGGPRQLDQGVGTLVRHGGVLRRHQGQNELDVFSLVLGLRSAHRPDQVEDDELQNVWPRWQLVELGQEVLDREVGRGGAEHQQSVPPCRDVLLRGQEVLQHHLARVRKELVPEEVVDGLDTHGRRPADEGVPVLEVAEDRRDQRLQDLELLDTAQEAQGDAPEVLVRVLQVVPKVLADQYHLWQKLSLRVLLLQLLEVQQQELLNRVVLAGEHVPHDCHKELRHILPVQHHVHTLFHSLPLVLFLPAFQRLLDLVPVKGLVAVAHQHSAVRLV